MKLVKLLARNTIIPMAVGLRVDKFLLKKHADKCLVVNFHGVRKSTGSTFNNRHLPVNDFEKLLKYFSENFNVVPLSEIFKIYREGKNMDRKTIALTFDDGYLNNFDVALPLLKKYKLPATFFIITRGLLEKDFHAWPDIIDVCRIHSDKDISLDGHLFEKKTFYSEKLKIDLSSYLKQQGHQTHNKALEVLKQVPTASAEFRKSAELLKLVNAEQLSAHKNENLVEYGSHSHNHPNMENLNAEDCMFEVQKSSALLNEITGRKTLSIAFPDGSYKSETLEICTAAGLTNLLAVDYKLESDAGDKRILNRFTISNSTTAASNILRLAKSFDRYSF